MLMSHRYVRAEHDVGERMVKGETKALKWIQSHSAAEIADKMPADYYAGDKSLYVTALQNQKAIFSADGTMPSDGPPTVLGIEQQIGKVKAGQNIDLTKTYTNTFASTAK